MLLDMLSYFLEYQSSRSNSLFTVYLEIEKSDEKNKKIRTGKLVENKFKFNIISFSNRCIIFK